MLEPAANEAYRNISMQRRIAVGPGTNSEPYSLRIYWENNAPGTHYHRRGDSVLTSYLTEDDVAWLIQEFLKERKTSG